MINRIAWLKKASAGLVLSSCVVTLAFADDIEIYTDANLVGPVAQPNIMFIMDSSSNMANTLPASEPYDDTRTYELVGGYDPAKIYYSSDGSIPENNGASFHWATANHCDHSERDYVGSVRGAVNTGPLYTVGMYSGQIAQLITTGNKAVWDSLNKNNSTSPVECIQDHGTHGSKNVGAAHYIFNDAAGWTNKDLGVAATVWANNANNYVLFAGNYLNYLVDPALVTSDLPLFDQLKNAISTLVASASNINVGLMQYDTRINIIDGIDQGGEGGAVMYPALDVNLGRQDFYSRLKTMNTGTDPVIAETYFEALRYFGGKEVLFGNNAVPKNQTGTTENGNPKFYETPITETCQKNYIIVVSNGMSRFDYIDQAERDSIPGFDSGSCNTGAYAGWSSNEDAFNSDGSTIDNCLDEMAGWALNNDIAERNFSSHEGDQNITTYTVGFAFPTNASQELLDGEQLLRDTAAKGGGRFMAADNESDLVRALNELVSSGIGERVQPRHQSGRSVFHPVQTD